MHVRDEIGADHLRQALVGLQDCQPEVWDALGDLHILLCMQHDTSDPLDSHELNLLSSQIS